MGYVEKPSIRDYMIRYRKPSPVTFLMHYGVKGMKWGVRRTPEELGHNKESVMARVNRRKIEVTTADGVHVVRMSSHAGDQAQNRKVKTEEIIDALQSPMYIKPTKADPQGRLSQQFIGSQSIVCVNPTDGTITSVWRTGKRIRKKYQEGE